MNKIKNGIKWLVKNTLAFFKDYYSIFIVSFLCLLTVELLNRPTGGFWDLINWFNTNTRAALLNYIVYLCINFIFYIVINRLNIANILFFAALNCLGIINYNKLIMKGENLIFWDSFQAMDAVKVVSKTSVEITWQLVFVGMMIFLVALWQLLGHRHRRRGTRRLKAFLAAFVVFSSLIMGVLFNNDNLQRLYLTNYDWNYDENFKENGFIVCYIMNLKEAVISEPKGYSDEKTQEVVESMEEQMSTVTNEFYTGDVKNPNVIAIMCESFADISVSNSGLTFSEDIMPNIHATNENVIKGNLVTSIFGGGTANSEFEFLTGNSCAFIPTGAVAYNTYVEEGIHSIVELFKARGYECIGVHPYDRRFYHRDEIYEYYGFDEFITEESFAKDCETKKGYISDREVYNMIVSKYESKEEDQPFFNFTVTMQNHTPYVDTSNGIVEIKYDSAIYNASKVEQAMVHAKGVKDGDQLFADLKAYFEKVDEPTVIVLFGDHHPYLSNTVNKDSSTLNEVTKYYTQYVIWANYDIEDHTDYTVSSSALSSVVLSVANFDLPDYLKYNLYENSIMSGYNPYYVLGRDGTYYTYHDEMTDDITEFLSNKEYIQYDNLFGSQYADEMWKINIEEGED